jgi:hypothetical protein
MDENRKVEFLKNIFGLVNLNEINDIINSKISLDELFKIHNLNTNLNFFILSLPKTGTNTIRHYIEKYKNTDVLSIHTIIEFLYIDKRFINYTIRNIVEYISMKTRYEKLNIIISYREPEKRYISRYLWNIKTMGIPNLFEGIKIIDKEIFNQINCAEVDYNFFIDNLNDFNLNLCKYTYDKEKGYTIIPYQDKINFVFTIIEDLEKMFKNFLHINIEVVEIINKNELNNREIFFENSLKYKIYDIERKFINFYYGIDNMIMRDTIQKRFFFNF